MEGRTSEFSTIFNGSIFEHWYKLFKKAHKDMSRVNSIRGSVSLMINVLKQASVIYLSMKMPTITCSQIIYMFKFLIRMSLKFYVKVRYQKVKITTNYLPEYGNIPMFTNSIKYENNIFFDPKVGVLCIGSEHLCGVKELYVRNINTFLESEYIFKPAIYEYTYSGDTETIDDIYYKKSMLDNYDSVFFCKNYTNNFNIIHRQMKIKKQIASLPTNVICINSVPGIGKSSFVIYLAKFYPVLYVDTMKHISKKYDLIDFIENIPERSEIIFIDEIDKYILAQIPKEKINNWWVRFVKMINNCKNVLIISTNNWDDVVSSSTIDMSFLYSRLTKIDFNYYDRNEISFIKFYNNIFNFSNDLSYLQNIKHEAQGVPRAIWNCMIKYDFDIPLIVKHINSSELIV